jgi:hypothetical protein
MSTSAKVFLGTFLPTGAATFVLVRAANPVIALGAGSAGLLIHWVLSRDDDHDGELADASYFFGFLLTLTFLAAGLVDIAAPSAGQSSSAVIFGFLKQLGAGLALTILGLVVRQVRTLASARAGSPDSLSEAQRELAIAMRALIRALDARPEEVAARELHETRAKAREATETLQRNVDLAAARVNESMNKLEGATNEVTSGLLRATSGLATSLTQNVERIQIEVAAALTMLATQRQQLEESVQSARTTSEATQRQLTEQMGAQLAEWRATLEASHRFLAGAQASLDGEYQRGLDAMSSAGTTFNNLADQVTKSVTALPNPAERLADLWSDVGALQVRLAQSIEAVNQSFGALGRESAGATGAMVKLERSTAVAAASIERGGADLGEALRHELVQMNRVLDEFTKLLERHLERVT